MHRTHSDRGYTLIIVLVILAVLLILGAGALRLASREVESAASGTHSTTMLACARAARQLLQSQLRLNANFPQTFSMSTGSTGGNDASTLKVSQGGDPDAPHVATGVKSIQLVSPQNCGRGSSGSGNFRNLSNQVLGRNGASAGACNRVIARCEDNSGRVQEVEFTIHYGLN